MKLQVLIAFIIVSSCRNAETKSGEALQERKETAPMVPAKPVGSVSQLAIKKDSVIVLNSHAEVKKRPRKIPLTRVFETGCSDANFNGEPVLVQLELTDKLLSDRPDTVPEYIKSIYRVSEQCFPKSIADDFEHGISTEQIHYPKLNFNVEVFRDEYSVKPFRTFHYSVRRELDGTLTIY